MFDPNPESIPPDPEFDERYATEEIELESLTWEAFAAEQRWRDRVEGEFREI